MNKDYSRIKHEFFHFLKLHNAYIMYRYYFMRFNLSQNHDLIINLDKLGDYAIDAFTWGDTIEGFNYWSDLYDEWCDYYFENFK